MDTPTPPRLNQSVVHLRALYPQDDNANVRRIAWYGQSQIVAVTLIDAEADLYQVRLADEEEQTLGGETPICIVTWN
jgi:hypothetical protein